ncbi:Alcohol dehydrogenase superfamily, zinc-type [Moelleriella libera RCEF 2490]|uniref:Alcohol dehydrogenase superfamily, zinc-type n=1 Tax=Moelleriella libera RCEF 2490 TaxID=1081109 RepID=A0A168F068_9HYPO|nr:Alcohol dehydrogenase superfamily, zinc-type [Moelleriella libera RCEF 2490]
MQAVVFEGPFHVSVKERPLPHLQDSRDVIIKVGATALCGSELHVYRGHQKSDAGFIMGHEFTGIVSKVGADVQTVQVGDRVVSPFTVSCGECFYCSRGFTARCERSLLFGSSSLDGGQAEYVRVPFADGTVIKAPDTISDRALLLMADIFPTGYFGVKSALQLSPNIDVTTSTIVVIGCGPVGLCAIACASSVRPRHLFAVDAIDSRLELARNLGAKPLNYKLDPDGMKRQILEATEGRGADMVVEVVGQSPALRTAFELVRPFGAISSIGVHNANIPWTGSEAYSKNIRLQMGRCPVRHVFGEALVVLERIQQDLEFMFDHVMPLTEATEGYEMFDKMKVQKVIFRP